MRYLTATFTLLSCAHPSYFSDSAVQVSSKRVINDQRALIQMFRDLIQVACSAGFAQPCQDFSEKPLLCNRWFFPLAVCGGRVVKNHRLDVCPKRDTTGLMFQPLPLCRCQAQRQRRHPFFA